MIQRRIHRWSLVCRIFGPMYESHVKNIESYLEALHNPGRVSLIVTE